MNLKATGAVTDTLSLITGSATTVDVVADWHDTGSPVPHGQGGSLNTAITTATTTEIVPRPEPYVARVIKTLSIRNKDSASNAVTVVRNGVNAASSTVAAEVYKVTLAAGDALMYDEDNGWTLVPADARAGLETVSAPGAISPSVYETHLEVDGTDAFTMGDGSTVGERKRITCITAANTPVGTVTLNGSQAAFASEPTAWVFTTVGQFVEFEWTATGWKLVDMGQIGTESLTTTQTANPLCLLHFVNLSGTNDYIQGNGIIAGQRSIWMATAGSTASTVSGVYYDEDASADGIDINLDAAGDLASLQWVGSRWLATTLVSATITT